MDKSDTDALRNAVQLLEHPSLAARLANMIGKPVELLGRALPAGASQAIAIATTKSLEAAVKVALLTIRGGSQESSQMLHRALAVASGAAGGAFGILSLPLNFPSRPSSSCAFLPTSREARARTFLADPELSLSCVEALTGPVGQRPMTLRRVAISLRAGFLRLPSRKLPASLLNAASLRRVAPCSCG